MAIVELNHVNVITHDVKKTTDFYQNVVGLKQGPRPTIFDIEGTWLYCGNQAILHIMKTDKPINSITNGIDHFALRADDYNSFITNLHKNDVEYNEFDIPELQLRQVNIQDPNGNHVEIQFAI